MPTTDREVAVAQVDKVLRLQYNLKIAEAQRAYEWLLGWCDGKGYDFRNVFEGARTTLRRSACGVHDTAAYNGAM